MKLFSAGTSSTQPVITSRWSSSSAAQNHACGLRSRWRKLVAWRNESYLWLRSLARARSARLKKSSTDPNGQTAISTYA
eukprot:4788432-Prymnesium_polylepis.1